MFKIKFPKAEQLKKQAFKYNRRQFRNVAIGFIKGIGEVLKHEAKTGGERYSKTFQSSSDHGYEIFLAFRWYRIYSGLNIELTERALQGIGLQR